MSDIDLQKCNSEIYMMNAFRVLKMSRMGFFTLVSLV